jgi:tRNA pseudouridine38-40 synthase
MPRVRLTVSYDGRPFAGWQSQPSGATVQDVLEAALARICKETRVPVHGSGRTDTGVHALGQVAHFDAPDTIRMDAAAWVRALNVHLPPAVRILDATVLPEDNDFHARFSAKGKTYRYEIDRGGVLSPFRAGLAWHHPHRIDVEFFRAAAAIFIGEHDFAAFAANRHDGKTLATTVRAISSIIVEERGETLAFTISGNGFLYKMVRLLVGSTTRCAEGRESIDWLRNLLEAPSGRTSQFCAPADGLYLVSVRYPE